MASGEEIFESFAPFIRDYIYTRGWQSLHPIQIGAAEAIFSGDENVLLTSSTASGKTEAALFPALSEIWEDEPESVGILYIAPLKCLINDQFERVEELCRDTDIPVCRWHGDVGAGAKARYLKNPRGILQITPESLESMLIRRGSDIPRIFGDLRFVVIDEIHILTGTDRGNQILCQLVRLAEKIGHSPRRIGLSATVGDPESAARWLGGGSGRDTVVPSVPRETIRWRLAAEHFYITRSVKNAPVPDIPDDAAEILFDAPKPEPKSPEFAPDFGEVKVGDDRGETINDAPSGDEGYEYLYDCVRDKKSIVFSNSREETEYVCATLRQIAERRHEPDIFLIHHGNLSASIREDAELKMKNDEHLAVTCASVTMELGIDIGRLERVVQMGAATSVSSFLQRLGRSGRRDAPPEMIMIFREEEALPTATLPELIPWELIRAIAIVELYREERFIEPPSVKALPYSLLFHQTLSVLAASGSLTAAELAATVLSLPPFAGVTKDGYKVLLLSMLRDDYLELTEERELLVGLRGEALVSSFKFFAVFKDSEDYTVRAGSDEIGTISKAPPKGDRFALAGRVWEVEEIDAARRLVFVHLVPGKAEISWPGDFGEVNTHILERMRRVIEEDTEYPYLREGAIKRLREARAVADAVGMTRHNIIPLGGSTWAYFPWLGTRSFRTLRRYLTRLAPAKLSGMDFGGCYYMTFKLEGTDGDALMHAVHADITKNGLPLVALVSDSESPLFDKFDPCLPPSLLRQAFVADHLRSDEIISRARAGIL